MPSARTHTPTARRTLAPFATRAPGPTPPHVRLIGFEWIEGWYNIRSLLSSLGYRPSVEYEAALAV
ncbi:hypothetical protein [Streptodolium elevatio]|uniref:Uncharacterized protein n=1 Tax=Streptodolium elevatio TaxID=3157996 RepID=A0ABV3DGE3_9ACTN